MIERELGRNALTVKCSFGGDKHGSLDTIYNNAKLKADSGHDWVVPATVAEKKKLMSEFIERKKDRKYVKSMRRTPQGDAHRLHRRGYILELKEDMQEYDGATLVGMLNHLRNEYAPQDVDFLESKLAQFEDPPNPTKPIETYFAKQERRRRLFADSKYPIEEHTMVLRATQHLGRDPNLAKKQTRQKKNVRGPSAKSTTATPSGSPGRRASA